MSDFAKSDGSKVVLKFDWPVMPLYGDELEHIHLYSEEYTYVPDGDIVEVEKKLDSITLRDDKTMVLETDPTQRFPGCVGNLRVVYDGLAQLYGEDGPVEAFDISFKPDGLIWKGNLHADGKDEHVGLTRTTATGTIIPITYWYTKHDENEHTGLIAINATGTLTNIHDI